MNIVKIVLLIFISSAIFYGSVTVGKTLLYLAVKNLPPKDMVMVLLQQPNKLGTSLVIIVNNNKTKQKSTIKYFQIQSMKANCPPDLKKCHLVVQHFHDGYFVNLTECTINAQTFANQYIGFGVNFPPSGVPNCEKIK